MILSSADFVNDRRIVLSGVDTFQIFLFVWNILLEFEKKHSCNSIPRKSSDYLISYLDIFILQKFDPIYLQAFLSIETIANLCNEIFPLKCSSSLRFYFSKFDFFLRSFLHTCLLSYMYTLELYAELQRVTEVSSLYLSWFIEFVNFHSSHHLYSHVIFDTSDSNNFYFLSFPKGTTSFSTECNDGCVVKCGIHSL